MSKQTVVGICATGQHSVKMWKHVLNTELPDFDCEVKLVYPKHCPDIDILMFDGGSDVSPGIYGENKHHSTICNPQRDFIEMTLYRYYLNASTKYAGICRGSQFLNVMGGGKLYQDLYSLNRGHSMRHNVMVLLGTKLRKFVNLDLIHVNSTHHQAVKTTGANLIPTLVEPGTRVIEGIESIKGDKIRAVQCHPENGTFLTSKSILNYLFRRDDVN